MFFTCCYFSAGIFYKIIRLSNQNQFSLIWFDLNQTSSHYSSVIQTNSVRVCTVLFWSIVFYCVLFGSTVFYCVLFCSIVFYCVLSMLLVQVWFDLTQYNLCNYSISFYLNSNKFSWVLFCKPCYSSLLFCVLSL